MTRFGWGGAWALVFMVCVGCGDDAPAVGDDASVDCSSDEECDDGLFCNGVEACDPAMHCTAGPEPCLAGRTCDEDDDLCRTNCDVDVDADGDGSDALECGGGDCDDGDADRFPGNAEVCDQQAHDEDCDPLTYGFRDADADGFPDARCCNETDGVATCGDDCDDMRPATSPVGAEICDEIDNDCDGSVDEGTGDETWHADADADGFGDDDDTVASCIAVEGRVRQGGDCDDADPAVNPDAAEMCDRVDSDCSSGGGTDANEDFDEDGHAPVTATCAGGPLPQDDCDDTAATRFMGAAKLCDGVDNDCDPASPLDTGCADGISIRAGSSTALAGSMSGTFFCEDPAFGSCGPGCPDGSALVGFTIRHDGTLVRQIIGRCRELAVSLRPGEEDVYDVTWGTASSTPSHGSTSGSTATSECPNDEWAIGIHGLAGTSIARLGAICATVAVTGTLASGYGTRATFVRDSIARGGSSGTTFRRQCDDDLLVGGYEGFLGAAVNSLAPFCGRTVVTAR